MAFLSWLVAWIARLGLLVAFGSQRTVALSCWRNTTCSSITAAAFPGKWDSNMFAPSSRTVTPSFRLDVDGHRMGAWTGVARMEGRQSTIVADFGREVGGVVSIDYVVESTSGSGALGMAFSESTTFIGRTSDSSSGTILPTDGALYANFSKPGEHSYVMPDESLRGGFRYMTLFLEAGAKSVNIRNISLEISFQPTWSNLRAYQGYFHSNDDLLNRIWYSGAYTLQTDAIDPYNGRAWPPPTNGGWNDSGLIGPGGTILTDGAKRDRTVWPGDLGVAVPAAFYSTGDLESVRNALQVMYDKQDSLTGEFPFSGPQLSASGSEMYHMWTMVGTYNYVLYSGNTEFLHRNWAKYQAGMIFAQNQVDDSGQFFVDSSTADWGRLDANGTLTSAQALFYHTLKTSSTLAGWANDKTGLSETWVAQADEIRNLALANNWDPSVGAFFDAPERTDIHPQDGNSLAVFFGIVDPSSTKAEKISTYLTTNWRDIGAECEELPGEISPFISSFEIQSHLLVGRTKRALELIRRSWGWYLNNAEGTQSTMIEGYLVNGTFGYRWDAGYNNDFSYTSHSHGWATGPVTALTAYVLGLSVTGRAGAAWRLAPQPGDLTSVQGGFTTKLGKFSAAWTIRDDDGGGGGAFSLNYSVPVGTRGDLLLPLAGSIRDVVVDGTSISKEGLSNSVQSRGGSNYLGFTGQGGEHSIVIKT